VARSKAKLKHPGKAEGNAAETSVARFKLPIGNKRQVTIPSKAMQLLSLKQGDDLLLDVAGEYAVLHPAVSVPRHELPEELWRKFAARRGAKPTDIPLKSLFEEIGYQSQPAEQKREQELDAKQTEGAQLARRLRDYVLGEKANEGTRGLDSGAPVRSLRSAKGAFKFRPARAAAGSGKS
jgi:bifunctional DNA-binding transcriptional regulator/antitoxin component of YhaV-PrlF toxin-antitoxin module